MLSQANGGNQPQVLGPSLPRLTINTVGGAPIVSKDDYVNASYTLTWPGHATSTGTLRIRGRGQTSWNLWHPTLPDGAYPPKKPYRLNFDNSIAPLGMSASQKNWALLADFYDTSKVKGPFAFTLARYMTGLQWSAEFRHVEVTLNGDYRGLYQLTDLARIESGRIAPPKASGTSGLALTGTYLMELDTYFIDNGDPGFVTSHGTPIAFDDPDGTNATQATYLEGFMEEFESRLYGSSWLSATPSVGYAELIDFASFADWYWVNEVIMQLEVSNPKSVKIYKTRDTSTTRGKLYCSTPWDHDLTLGANWITDFPEERLEPPEGWYVREWAFWFPRLIQDPAFDTLLRERWAFVKSVIENELGGLEHWFQQFYGKDLAPAIMRDRERWIDEEGGVLTPGNLDLADEMQYATDWLTDRIAWIDSQLNA